MDSLVEYFENDDFDLPITVYRQGMVKIWSVKVVRREKDLILIKIKTNSLSSKVSRTNLYDGIPGIGLRVPLSVINKDKNKSSGVKDFDHSIDPKKETFFKFPTLRMWDIFSAGDGLFTINVCLIPLGGIGRALAELKD